MLFRFRVVLIALTALAVLSPRAATAQEKQIPASQPSRRMSFARPAGQLPGARPLSPPGTISVERQFPTVPSAQPVPRVQTASGPVFDAKTPGAKSVLEKADVPTRLDATRSILVTAPSATQQQGLSAADFADLALPTARLGGAEQGAGAGAGQTTQTQELPRPTTDGRRPLIPPDPSGPAFNPLDALPPELLGHSDTSSSVGSPQSVTATNAPARNAAPNTGAPNTAPQSSMPQAKKGAESSFKYDGNVSFGQAYTGHSPTHYDALATKVPFHGGAFQPQPIITNPLDPHAEGAIYRSKRAVPTQRPLIELGRPLYTGGIYKPARNWFGATNLVMPHFMVYGDFRTAVAINRNANSNNDVWASRLNLDMDLEITATERIHAFMGPLDRAGDFTRLDFSDGVEFVNGMDMRFDTLFFEGDLGSIAGGLSGTESTFDLPFSFGFLPLFYQNGVWANDNVIGAAAALPARHSRLLDWSNFDATVFWASDQVTSDAFAGDNNAAEFFGTAWFIEAYDGYLEVNYAFVHDDVGGHRSYNNLAVAFTRRYFHRVSNCVRFITNFGQSLPSGQRTADGHLLLIENSLISKQPNTLVPYLNFFYGQGRTQSLARAGIAGGVLNNVGINFETDGLTGYPTLDPTGVNTVGAAAGINMLGSNFDHQLILEFAALSANGSQQFRNASGDQYAIGMRYQKPLNNAWIFRTDHMAGILRNSRDLFGSRMELRWKF